MRNELWGTDDLLATVVPIQESSSALGPRYHAFVLDVESAEVVFSEYHASRLAAKEAILGQYPGITSETLALCGGGGACGSSKADLSGEAGGRSDERPCAECTNCGACGD